MKYKYAFTFFFFLTISFTAMAQAGKINIDSLVSLVKQAYIYGYPIEQSYRMYVTTPDNTGQTKRLYNHFSYSNKLAEASKDNTAKVADYKSTRNRGGAGPNSDTPYFGSLLDLSSEPIVLSAPNFGKRYYSFHFINFYNQNVFYIGYHFGDTTTANYLLIGPGWKGKVPVGLKPIRFKDNRLNLFGRVLVEDDTLDLKRVIALQHQATLTPLSKWPAGRGNYAGDEHPELPAFYAPIDSFFNNLNSALQLSPPPVQDKTILAKLRKLGIGTDKGFDWNKYDKSTQLRIYEALVKTDSLLDAEAASGDVDFGNGWQRTNPLIGHWGTDYWDEALYIKHGFYAGNTETENFYIIPKSREGHGFFKGDHKYLIHFAKGALPPLYPYGFWSMTAYEIPGYFLIPNPIHRPSIRDRSKNLKYNADGSIDIYLQASSPGPDKESNWLPIAKTESTVTFRVYLPENSLLKNEYKLPPIQTVE
jgi:hypothetical protein